MTNPQQNPAPHKSHPATPQSGVEGPSTNPNLSDKSRLAADSGDLRFPRTTPLDTMDCFREFTRLEIETDLFNPRQRPEVRAAAAQALGGIGAEAVWVLAGALGDREVGALSAEQLVKIGKPALPALLVAVQDVSNQRFQHRAAEAIGKIGAAEAVPTLQKVLKTDDSSASAAAARALGEIKHQSAAAALIDGLAFDDIQETVTTALESMGEIAVPALIEAAKDEGRNPRTRALAIRVLGSIPSRVGNQDIINALDSTNSEIRGEAFRAIGRRKAPEALPALIKALEHDTDKIVRYLAATALGTIGDPRAIPALENRLGGRLSFIVSGPETDQDVRRAIGAALEKLNAS